MEGSGSGLLPSWKLSGPARPVQTQLVLVLLFALSALVFYRTLKWLIAVLRLKQYGNAIPGPKASWLSGNSAQMIDAGGLTFFLEYLHDR